MDMRSRQGQRVLLLALSHRTGPTLMRGMVRRLRRAIHHFRYEPRHDDR